MGTLVGRGMLCERLGGSGVALGIQLVGPADLCFDRDHVEYVAAARARSSGRLMFVGVGFVITIGAFAIARWAAFELFSGGIPGGSGLGPAIALLLAGLIVSVGLTVAMNRWLVPLHYWTGILVAVGLILVLPLSFATIRVFPAFNGNLDEIHSIKMGYPVFWTAVLVPAALRLGRKSPTEAR